MHKAKLDLAVLLIFFARPNTLAEVFQKVKEARPSKLFLACDGPRAGNTTDAKSIEECKRIVSDIDWECEVYTNYSETNQGCGRGPSNAISWAFTHVDKLLILEDDCVADDTLFPFMKEMLDRYENDERVGIVSGFNHMKNWETGPFSYCFAKCAATLGWGTWRRVWEKYDYHVSSISEPYVCASLYGEFPSRKIARRRISDWKRAAWETKEKKVNYWDIQFGFLKYTQSYLCVVPKNNLIYNIGVGAGSTHTESNKAERWKKGKVLFMPTEPLEFPLVHPNTVICDKGYDKEVFKIVFPGKIKKIFKKILRMLGL
ncbi:MAG: hemolysin activation protein [Clostridia bacterium]|nr:hemolysin activation protein [Clostridia bacterium]